MVAVFTPRNGMAGDQPVAGSTAANTQIDLRPTARWRASLRRLDTVVAIGVCPTLHGVRFSGDHSGKPLAIRE